MYLYIYTYIKICFKYITDIASCSVTLKSNVSLLVSAVNLLMPGGNKKVTHT